MIEAKICAPMAHNDIIYVILWKAQSIQLELNSYYDPSYGSNFYFKLNSKFKGWEKKDKCNQESRRD